MIRTIGIFVGIIFHRSPRILQAQVKVTQKSGNTMVGLPIH